MSLKNMMMNPSLQRAAGAAFATNLFSSSSTTSSHPPMLLSGLSPAATSSTVASFQSSFSVPAIVPPIVPVSKAKPLDSDDVKPLVKWGKASCKVLTPFQLSPLSPLVLPSTPFAGASFLKAPTSSALGWKMHTPMNDQFNAFSKPLPGFSFALRIMKTKVLLSTVLADKKKKQDQLLLEKKEQQEAKERKRQRFHRQRRRFSQQIQLKFREFDKKRNMRKFQNGPLKQLPIGIKAFQVNGVFVSTFFQNSKGSLVQLLAETWK